LPQDNVGDTNTNGAGAALGEFVVRFGDKPGQVVVDQRPVANRNGADAIPVGDEKTVRRDRDPPNCPEYRLAGDGILPRRAGLADNQPGALPVTPTRGGRQCGRKYAYQ
jgi:hypothetical protein